MLYTLLGIFSFMGGKGFQGGVGKAVEMELGRGEYF